MSTARAEEKASKPASFSLQFSGLKFTQTKYIDEPNDSEITLTRLNTSDLDDSKVWVNIGKFNLYFYPFQNFKSLISLGYEFRDDLEIGLNLGLNSSKSKNPKAEQSSDLLGAYVLWTVPFEDYFLENSAALDVTRSENKAINATTNKEETTKITGNYFKISGTVFVPIAKNAWYFAGIWWANENEENHALDINGKEKQFGLTLAGLRVTME